MIVTEINELFASENIGYELTEIIKEEVVEPVLQKNKAGLKKGEYILSHCPERINPGDPKWNVSNIPRVVGALCPEGLEKVKNFYQNILSADVKVLSSIEAAEMTKIYENSFCLTLSSFRWSSHCSF